MSNPRLQVEWSSSNSLTLMTMYSPSDFAFPHDAVMAETTPNTEMTLIVDLDLEKLDQLRLAGSVQNLAQRRTDLYSLRLSSLSYNRRR